MAKEEVTDWREGPVISTYEACVWSGMKYCWKCRMGVVFFTYFFIK